MAAPSGIIVAFLGAHASLPSGWTRVTDLDAKYLRGAAAAANPGTTGGNATHTHTVTDHTHVQNGHTHSATTGASTTGSRNGRSGSSYTNSHVHAAADSGSTTATNQNATVTLDGTSNDPSYYEVIWVQSGGTNDIPNNCVAWSESLTPPTGWNLCDGNNTTPNLTDKFLKGAATGADAGGSGAGNVTHTHTNTAHNHTQDAHNHTGTTGAMTTNATVGTGSSQAVAMGAHTHTYTAGNVTAVNAEASVTVNNGTNEPPYRKLAPHKNNGTNNTPVNIIAVWTGTLANIPTAYGWKLCDGNNNTPDLQTYFVKNTTSGTLSTTGGSASHGHTASAHTHTQTAHGSAHGPVTSSSGGTTSSKSDTTANSLTTSHTHAVSFADTTATNQDTTVTIADNTDARPPFYDVAYVKYFGHYTLTVADAAHAHTADNLTITPSAGAIQLTVADASHAVTSDTPTLTAYGGAITLTVADATHSLSSENAELTQHYIGTADDASHVLTSDETSLVVDLIVADASHILRSDRRTLVVNLIVADASSTSDSDEVTITSNYTAIADDSSHSSASDNTTLSHKYAVIVADGIHSLFSYIQIFPLIYFQQRDTMLYYHNRGKVDYTINQLYSDVLETETESTITTEDGNDIEIDYYKDVLTKPIILTYENRDTNIHYYERGKTEFTVNQTYSDVLETEAGETITTEDSEDIDIDYYKDVLTYPIMLNYQQRDFTISEN